MRDHQDGFAGTTRALRIGVAGLFLLSGCTALVYQVVWVRIIALTTGQSMFATATVIASFMAGLGIGARVGGAWAGRVRAPLAAYGLLEAGIGAYALASPTLLAALDPLIARLGASTALTLFLAGLALLPPTIAMGATLPLLTRWYARAHATLGRDMGWLYAVNTTGALIGAGLAGFVALPTLGLPATLAMAAGVNIGVGLLAIVVGLRFPVTTVPGAAVGAAAPSTAAISTPRERVVLFAFAVSGCAAMIDQIAWNRSFSLFTGSTTYAFSLIVCAFIGGLAGGGYLFARIVDRVRDREALLASVNAGIALSTAALIPGLGILPWLLLEPLAARADSFVATQAFVFGVLFALLVLPTVLMGGIYPIATRLLAADPALAPRQIGRAYAWNTLGAIAGSLLAAFVLIPTLRVQGTLWVGVTVHFLAASAVLVGRRRSAALLPALGLAGLLGSPHWDPRIMNLAPHMYGRDLVSDPALLTSALEGGSIVFHEEGLGANVTVFQRESGERVLRINGKTDASTHEDRLAQGLLGALPTLLATHAEDVFVLGLGSGMTLASVLDQPVESVVVYELLPEVTRAAEAFGPLIGAPLADARVHLKRGDGRHELRYTDREYDVISAQPTNIFVSGMATLFTAEAFAETRARLRAGGVAAVWLQGYLLHDEDFRTIVRTFQAVFGEAHLWNAGPFDFLLTGHTAPLHLDDAALQARIDGMGPQTSAWTGLDRAADLQRHYLLGPEALAAFAGGGPTHRDRDPTLEYSAPMALYGTVGRLDIPQLLSMRHALPDVPATTLQTVRAIDAASLRGDVDALEHALLGDPMHPAGRRRLARLLHARAMERAQKGDLANAELDARQVTLLEPGVLPGWELLARLLVLRGAGEKALTELQLVSADQPWNPFAQYAVASLATHLGHPDIARAAMAAAGALDPGLAP